MIKFGKDYDARKYSQLINKIIFKKDDKTNLENYRGITY